MPELEPVPVALTVVWPVVVVDPAVAEVVLPFEPDRACFLSRWWRSRLLFSCRRCRPCRRVSSKRDSIAPATKARRTE